MAWRSGASRHPFELGGVLLQVLDHELLEAVAHIHRPARLMRPLPAELLRGQSGEESASRLDFK